MINLKKNEKKNRGIEEMKKTKIILIAALGICMLSFMPAVFGKADSRPIEDFTDTNFNVAAWTDSESGFVVIPHGHWVPDIKESIDQCIHHGSVLERDLKDGRILFKINLHVKGALMEVWWMGAPFGPVIIGEMDYTFTATVIVNANFGDPVPNLLAVWFAGLGEELFSHITLSGTGTFTDLAEANGLGVSGESVNLKLVQVGMLKGDVMVWHVEVLNFH